jgi:tetratricopeptide (TPR) repeat protein
MNSPTCAFRARAWIAQGVLWAATAATASIGACAAQAAPVEPPTLPDDIVDAFDVPDGASLPDTDAATRADLPRLMADGEAAYRARRADEALAAFQRVVALDPGHALAWLRIGNLHQQRRDWFKALAAYRRVAARSSGEGIDPALRAKALHNLAMINLELAQQTLRTLERMGPAAAAAGPREPLSAAVAAARRRLEAFAPPGGPSRSATTSTARPAAAASSAPAPVPAPRAPSGARPSQKGSSRAAASASASAHAAEPELPQIDYIRGAPRP